MVTKIFTSTPPRVSRLGRTPTTPINSGTRAASWLENNNVVLVEARASQSSLRVTASCVLQPDRIVDTLQKNACQGDGQQKTQMKLEASTGLTLNNDKKAIYDLF
jgi:hypothetical protein